MDNQNQATPTKSQSTPTADSGEIPKKPTDIVKMRTLFGGTKVGIRGLTIGGAELGTVGKTNTDGSTSPLSLFAIFSLIIAVFIPIIGIVCGHIALMRTKRLHQSGHDIALAATIIGYVLTFFISLIVVGLIIFVRSHPSTN